MRINKNVSNGFTRALSLNKLALLIYILTFIFSLLLGISFNLSISSHNYNPMFSKLFADFDYTIFNDFMNKNGMIIKSFINSMIMFSFFYLFMELFFVGGVISKLFSPGKKIKMTKFFANGVKYFWRFTKLFLYKIISLLIIFGIIVTITSVIFESFTEYAVETDYVNAAVILTLVFLILFVFISAISDYTKMFIVGANIKNVWDAIKSAFRFIMKNFITGISLYIIGLMIFIVLTIIYLVVFDLIPLTNMFSLFVLFVVQQMFIFLRIFAKVFTLSTEYDFYSTELIANNNSKQSNEILRQKADLSKR